MKRSDFLSGDWITFWFGLLIAAFLLFAPGSLVVRVSIEGLTGASAAAPVNNASCFDVVFPNTVVTEGRYRVRINCWNIGSTVWTASGDYKLGAANPHNNTVWGAIRAHLGFNDAVQSFWLKQFQFDVTAPSTPGTYDFSWQMLREGVEWFGNVISKSVTVIPCSQSDCAVFRDQNVPTIMTVGQEYDALITMKNTGTTDWLTPAGAYALGIEDQVMSSLWSTPRTPVSRTVLPGEEETFEVRIKAPPVPGDYVIRWRMHSLVQGGHYFGDSSIPVRVTVVDDSSSIIMESSFESCNDAPLNGCGPHLPVGITPWTQWKNTTASAVQINRIAPVVSFTNLDVVRSGYGLDVCFYLIDANGDAAWSQDYLAANNPDPHRSGIREHGCGGANAATSVTSNPLQHPVVFAHPLYLEPGWTLAVQSALWGPSSPSLEGNVRWNIGVTETFVGGTSVDIGPGLEIIRFPIVDEVFPIDPKDEAWTTWELRRNDTGSPLYIWGFQPFFSLAPGVEADACLYVLHVNGSVKRTYCYPHQSNNAASYVNPPGINFADPIVVGAGEYFVGHHYFRNNNNWQVGADGGMYVNITKGLPPELY